MQRDLPAAAWGGELVLWGRGEADGVQVPGVRLERAVVRWRWWVCFFLGTRGDGNGAGTCAVVSGIVHRF